MAATLHQPKRVGFDNLIQTIRTNKNSDTFTILAAERFNKKPQDVTEDERSLIKTRVLMALYN